MPPTPPLNFLGSIFPFVVLMNWIYYRSGRNILVAVVFHLMANIGNEVFLTHPDTKTLQTMLVVLVSGVVLWRERALFFTRPGAPRSFGGVTATGWTPSCDGWPSRRRWSSSPRWAARSRRCWGHPAPHPRRSSPSTTGRARS